MSPKGSAVSSIQDLEPRGSNAWWILCLCHFFFFTAGLKETEFTYLTLGPHFPHAQLGLCWLGCGHGFLKLGNGGNMIKKKKKTHPDSKYSASLAAVWWVRICMGVVLG